MLQDLPSWERPREKLLSFGASSLSNSELIAILISSGSKDDSAITLASKVLSLEPSSLSNLSIYEPEEFMQIKGIGLAKACSIVAAMELGRRISASPKTDRIPLKDAKAVANLFMEEMKYLNKEVVKIAMLNVQTKLIAKTTISVGDIKEAAAHPREVFAPAIRKGAAAIVIVHNHPSGEAIPSVADIESTKSLVAAGKILQIPVMDHVIIGDNCYVSLSETHKSLFN